MTWRLFVVTNSFVQIVERLRSYDKVVGLTDVERMNSLLPGVIPGSSRRASNSPRNGAV
jgi:hypothetical protein